MTFFHQSKVGILPSKVNEFHGCLFQIMRIQCFGSVFSSYGDKKLCKCSQQITICISTCFDSIQSFRGIIFPVSIALLQRVEGHWQKVTQWRPFSQRIAVFQKCACKSFVAFPSKIFGKERRDAIFDLELPMNFWQ